MSQIETLVNRAQVLFGELEKLPLTERVDAINQIRQCLHEVSPFSNEPVDCVQWVRAEEVEGNDYNPNTVAPPEMKLLAISIDADGFTQPIVTCPQDDNYLVVDGFHRVKIGRKEKHIKRNLNGYLPIVTVRPEREGKENRIAATIRHNRARGVHGVIKMTDIVIALIQTGWSDIDVARELGMDYDEVLRFKQVSGLPELFKNHDYSKSWD